MKTRKKVLLGALLACAVAFGTYFYSTHLYAAESVVKDARPVPPFHPTDFTNIKDKATFLVFGDWGTGDENQKLVAQRMAEKAQKDGAQFAVVLGDNFYPKGVESVTDPQWKTKYEDIYTQKSLQIPFYVATGNHDEVSSLQSEIDFTGHDNRWHMPARYYTFSEPVSTNTKIDFFELDTTPIAENIKSDIKEQQEWLEKALAKSTAKWKIVYGHHPVFSYGVHGDTETMIEYFKPIFEKYHVDVYFCGHEHDLQILKPVNGVHYIVSGGGAKHRNARYGDNTIFAMTNLGFLWCAATDNTLEAQFVDRDGKIVYAYDIN
ncbi:MAG TPA: tartrate-resistant acid phosphatase type 5 family protein, partial [Candidatus Kapabacteria bacterium]|nr:tartrate-resistant acid phosphatase type 5 family protein [Candidatus Kapabacteria bacterium]